MKRPFKDNEIKELKSGIRAIHTHYKQRSKFNDTFANRFKMTDAFVDAQTKYRSQIKKVDTGHSHINNTPQKTLRGNDKDSSDLPDIKQSSSRADLVTFADTIWSMRKNKSKKLMPLKDEVLHRFFNKSAIASLKQINDDDPYETQVTKQKSPPKQNYSELNSTLSKYYSTSEEQQKHFQLTFEKLREIKLRDSHDRIYGDLSIQKSLNLGKITET